MIYAAESSPSPCGDGFRLFWVRENAPGHLEFDSGIHVEREDLILAIVGVHPLQHPGCADSAVRGDRVTAVLSGAAPLGSLPAWMAERVWSFLNGSPALAQGALAMASRIRSCAEAAGGEVELHLPPMNRREWTRRQRIMAGTEFILERGAIVPRFRSSPARSVYSAQLVAATANQRTAQRELRCRVRFPGRGVYAGTFFPLVVSGPLAVTWNAEFEVRLAAEACRAWKTAPPEKSAEYFPAHARVSMAVQNALRRWVPFLWFADPERLERALASHAVLAYRAGSIYRGKRRTDFTYDTMSTEWFRPFFRPARRPLAAVLKVVREQLLADGKLTLAKRYYPAHRCQILTRLRKQRRLMHDLVSGEGAIVGDILKFGLSLREVDGPAASKAATVCMRRLRVHLRSMLPGADFGPLAPWLLFEATNALHVALGGAPAIAYSAEARPVRELTLAA
jgi:hypothetical protein